MTVLSKGCFTYGEYRQQIRQDKREMGRYYRENPMALCLSRSTEQAVLFDDRVTTSEGAMNVFDGSPLDSLIRDK